MKRRPLRAVGGFGLYAVCVFLSTVALQSLTTPSPFSSLSFFTILNPIDSFLWNVMTSSSEPPEISTIDFRLFNLSVCRIRFMDEDVMTEKEKNQIPRTNSIVSVHKTLMEFLTITTTSRRSAEVSSVVVTWEDHPLAVHARAKNARGDSMSESYLYEVQIWVTDWGLDGLWNAANRRVTSLDPFLVLVDLPLEYELGFRVRMKAKETKKSVLGYLLPMGFLATEIDGEWSDVVTLSPTRNDELEAIVTSLADNKLLVVLLAVCMGSGCLVVVQLYVRRGVAVTRTRKLLKKMYPSRRTPFDKDNTGKESSRAAATDVNTDDRKKSMQELQHEIHDLRQELADAEDEVRQLMLFSGCGIETLAPHELEQLECEVKHTLKRIQYLKKHGSIEMRTSTKGQRSVTEFSRREIRRLKKRDDSLLSPIHEHRSFEH
ncbi:unnamed protein product [Peronospora destructor]|uniref:K-box domain-containing protein n=1 Tax=Peronospora destructor TaxID=86335 RepID=A0AAV0T1N2_9STRA|nr:unnamed protein product [Peronospora destructor]